MARKNDKALTRANNPNELRAYLGGAREKALRQWCENRIDAAALVRFAVMDYAKSPQLRKCSPESIYLALIACAQVGLEPGGVRQEAFIVPYGSVAQFQLGYRGIIRLAYESPLIKRISANVVREADQFQIDIGSASVIEHKPALGGQRGDVIGAYAYAVLADGDLEVEWMDLDDLDRIEATAKTTRSDSPWSLWRDQMQRKSPVKRLGKRLPLSSRAALAMALDNAAESGHVDQYNDALRGHGIDVANVDPEPQSGVDGLKSKLGIDPVLADGTPAPETNSERP